MHAGARRDDHCHTNSSVHSAPDCLLGNMVRPVADRQRPHVVLLATLRPLPGGECDRAAYRPVDYRLACARGLKLERRPHGVTDRQTEQGAPESVNRSHLCELHAVGDSDVVPKLTSEGLLVMTTTLERI